ncbi:3-oxoacyl-[acyl-carrier protein] reductase [Pseudoxanthomonas sp. GM95]|uniref:SDR family NAD(P)-dependent oxidoreductase n=1 Tax=Pseudoxanthomonas sp. GM95 TaxID=1881043 RepID=UPI0008AE17A7|nr:SDR family oxidoreductase [Pseudoxanthomonas sp. GM95]SEL12468.1 3-oxoacyl-[acyl-carrier protein] reductase [Pseudoxanthomonas sp. GM95]
MHLEQQAEHRSALIFGGSRGIGAAISKRLAREGHSVALTYVSRPDAAEEVVTGIRALGGVAMAIKADSTDKHAVDAAVHQTVERLGPLKVAVVNAGIYRSAPLEEVSSQMLDELLNINVRGAFFAIQSAASVMGSGARIITIGSSVAIRSGFAGGGLYSMTKAGLAALVRELAVEISPRGITINNVQPGPVETEITAGFLDAMLPRSHVGRVGQPEDIASLVSYIAGSESSYMTGTSITMDGGFVL